MTHFSFDFIPSALESYELHIKCPVGFGRQWWTFVSRHFFWIQAVLSVWKRDKDTSLNFLHIATLLHLIWFSSLKNVLMFVIWFIMFWEGHVINYFSGTKHCGILHLWCIFSKIFILKAAAATAACFFLILLHLLVLPIVENPELLNFCTDICTNCSAVEEWNMLLYPFLSF